MTRVLVTGGAGFIPSRTSSAISSRTPSTRSFSLDALTYAGNVENLAEVMSHPRLSFVHGDIRDAALVRELVAGVEMIVNAAAESHVEKSILEGASEFVTTNVEGTQILLDAIRETPVERFLLISSSEVYGTAESDPMDERHPLEPRSPYAATKAGGDRLAYSYWVTYELPVVIVRPFNNYGPRQHPEKVVPRFVTQALQGQPLTIHGDGHASRDWLHVDDTRRRSRRSSTRRSKGSPARSSTSPPVGTSPSRRSPTSSWQPWPTLPRRRCTCRSVPGRSTGTSAPPRRWSGSRAGARRSRSRTVSSERSRGTARTRRGGEASWVGPSPSPRPRRRPRAARAARGGSRARRRPRDRRRSRRGGGGAAARRRAGDPLDRGRGGHRPARALEVDGIVSPGADWPVGIAARIAARLGLPHPIDAATGAVATSKLRQRERFAAAGVPHAAAVEGRDAEARRTPAGRREGARPSGAARADARHSCGGARPGARPRA